jgi:restriction endonuclease, S subunit
MKTLPNGWAKTNLSNVSTINYGKSIQKHERNSTGKYPVIGSSGIIGHHNKFLVTSPCIVIGRKGAAGSTFLVKEDCWPIDTTFYLVSNNGVNSTFLNLLLKHKNLGQLDKSTTIPSLSRDDLYQTHIDLPPEREQVRISEKLEELLSHLDAGMAELQTAQKKLTQYRQSLLKAAVEGQLTADWRKKNVPAEDGAQLLERILSERRTRWEAKQLAKFNEQGKKPPKGWQDKYPEPARPDTANLPELPEGWVWATIDQVSLHQRYGSSAKTNDDKSGVPVLRMGNIQDGSLDLSSLKHLPKEHHEFPDLLLKKNDVLFNRTNSYELVGKTAIYKGEPQTCSYASYLICITPSPLINPEGISFYINSSHGRRWIASVVTQQVGQANVNGSKLSSLSIPLPPKEEQDAISHIAQSSLQDASFLEEQIKTGITLLNKQRQNILRAAFAGELVPQDPNDEPASELLARIAAERAAKQVAKRAPTERNKATGIEPSGTKRRKRKEAS